MKIKAIPAVLAVAALAGSGAAVALASGGGSGSAEAPSRLDDGKNLLPQASITEEQAISSARTAASGDLNDVDLEHYAGKLVFNVDVGSHDVKVDASNGDVVGVAGDD